MLLFEKLDEIRNLNAEVNGMLSIIENNIKSIMLIIKNKSDFLLAESDFIKLFEIQNELAIVKYKYNHPLNDFLSDFVYNFDRQDEYNMKYLFDSLLRS